MRLALFALLALTAGCVADLPNNDPIVGATPLPSGVTALPSGATATPYAGPCGTAAPNAQQIGVTLEIAVPASPPTPYGPISGYGLIEDGQIDATDGAVIDLLPSDTVQFYNTDSVTGRLLSAAGVAASAIPTTGAFPTPYVFPTNAASPIGTQINTSGTWSTGLLETGCDSQVFTFPGPGTYYFGDVDYYAENVRDVFVVSASAPQSRRHQRPAR